jgi:hypothetical protein
MSEESVAECEAICAAGFGVPRAHPDLVDVCEGCCAIVGSGCLRGLLRDCGKMRGIPPSNLLRPGGLGEATSSNTASCFAKDGGGTYAKGRVAPTHWSLKFGSEAQIRFDSLDRQLTDKAATCRTPRSISGRSSQLLVGRQFAQNLSFAFHSPVCPWRATAYLIRHASDF